MNPQLSRCCAAFGLLMSTCALGDASAASLDYLLNGTTSSGSFSLTLSFEDRAPSPTLSNFDSPRLVYTADAWSLSLFDADGSALVGPTASDLPGSQGYVQIASEINDPFAPTPGTSFFAVGLSALPLSPDPLLNNPLIEANFTYDDLIFGDDLPDVPAELTFTDGVFDTQDVNDASLSSQSIEDTEPSDVVAEDSEPGVVPSPTAAGGGLLLLTSLWMRRRRPVTA